MSPGREDSDGIVLFTQSTSNDYEHLCALDVLGLVDTHENDQQAAYKEFTEQLESDERNGIKQACPGRVTMQPCQRMKRAARDDLNN